MVACNWNMLSPVGPALQEEGGSRARSINSCSMVSAYSFLGIKGADAGNNNGNPRAIFALPHDHLSLSRTLLMRLRAMAEGLEN